MTFRKGKKIKWKKSGKVETIERASNNRRTGNIVTDKREYSTDFLYRQLDFGFIEIL